MKKEARRAVTSLASSSAACSECSQSSRRSYGKEDYDRFGRQIRVCDLCLSKCDDPSPFTKASPSSTAHVSM
eukprot:1246232-Karenia_brevis.AAC.1